MDYALRASHIRRCVRDALTRHGVSHDSPLRTKLETGAILAAGTNSQVVMSDGNSLDAAIENWLSSQRLTASSAGSFPTDSRTLAKSDTDGVQRHFADIASGKVRVE